jgi:Protein of unknown function (DUF2786)
MGKVSRQRRLEHDRRRQRQRAARDGAGADGARVAELVTGGVTAAMSALCDGDFDGFNAHVDLLAIDHVPGWTRVVSQELTGFLRSSVTAAWRHGWQPAELVRHVGRQLAEAHEAMVADVIVDEMRAYPTAAVDDRWAAQVAALGTRGRLEGEYLTARPLIAVAVQLLHFFQYIPALERLCPLPGTARARLSRTASEADARVLAKIRALLTKAESTEFPDEAEALSARAQELMAKYSIDHALLAAESGQADTPGGRRLPVDNPYESPKAMLLQNVAEANRCRAIWQKELGMSAVIGFAADLDAVELLFTSLLVQANTAMMRAGAKKDAYGRSRTRAFRQSFLIAYAIRIGERLSGAAEQAEHDAAASSGEATLLPVLAARHQAVDDTLDNLFGDRLVATGRGIHANDWEGWNSGLAAADLAALSSRPEVVA